jgi:ribosomal-protein-alanine N-acetyltransferase
MTRNDGAARVRLRPLTPDDQDEFIAQARASTGLHHPWYTMPTTPEAFQPYLAKYSQPTAEGWLVCLRDSGTLAGMITIDSIVRGRFQSATLSYAALAPAAGRGDKEGDSPPMLLLDGAGGAHERWAITREMTAFPPVDPHPTLPAR